MLRGRWRFNLIIMDERKCKHKNTYVGDRDHQIGKTEVIIPSELICMDCPKVLEYREHSVPIAAYRKRSAAVRKRLST